MDIRKSILSLAVAAAIAATALPASAADYVQASGVLGFASEYQGERFDGVFPDFEAALSFDPAVPEEARLEVTIPLSSADTQSPDRDGTLKSEAFFNVAEHATARYTATGFQPQGDNRYLADGTLQLRGISKPVQLTLTLTPGESPVLEGQALVRRLDFDVGAGDWADLSIIPNDVAITTQVHFQPAS